MRKRSNLTDSFSGSFSPGTLTGQIGTSRPGENLHLESEGLIGNVSPKGYQSDTIKGISYIKDETFHGNTGIGEIVMDVPLPPWGVVVLEGPSVEAARSEFFKAKSRGAVLFRIPFDTYGPRGTPESRARFGVRIVQIASILKGSSIASLRPEHYGGAVSEKTLPESYRLDYLRMIASQGFAWVEVEQYINPESFGKITENAKRANSRIMATCRLEDRMEWEPPEGLDPASIDGYRIMVPVKDGKGLRRMIRASINARKWIGSRKLVVEPLSGSHRLPSLLTPVSISDMIDLRPGELDNHGKKISNRPDIWYSLGLLGNTMSKQWSLNERTITPETMLFLQIGRIGDSSFRTKLFNSQFNKQGLNGMMLPWGLDNADLPECLSMAGEMDIRGMFVEMPLKSSVLKKMDWTDPRSRSVGSIDVVSIRKGKTYGYNSEVYGIGDQIATTGLGKDSKALILGTGTSGRAAAVASSMLGISTYLAGTSRDRTSSITSSLQGDIRATSYKALRRPGVHFDMIINSVPFETRNIKGMEDQTMQINEMIKSMEPKMGIDLYSRLPWTPFLTAVESRNGLAIPGADILQKTSLRAFKLLTGNPGTPSVIRSVIESEVLAK